MKKMAKNDLNYEPMDVDTSGNSVSRMEISYNDSDDQDIVAFKTEKEDFQLFFDANSSLQNTTIREKDINASTNLRKHCNVKRYHIKIERKSKEDHKTHFSKLFKSLYLALLILLASVVVAHYFLNISCTDDGDLEYIEEMLSKNLFGQENAIKEIISAMSMNVSSKILFFYGSTGVGKTYAASIIMERFWQALNFYHYTMPNFLDIFSTEFMIGLVFCKTSVIVVDDLRPKDLNIKPAISKLIERSEGLSKNITIILIFNCEDVSGKFEKKCNETFLHMLKSTFSDIKAEKTFIKFKNLSNKNLKKCIEKELNGKNISPQEMSAIVRNFDVALDGCKGVHTRVKFLNFD